MMDDLKIYERLSDLLYKDLLGMTSKEEKQELDSLCEEYGVKEMDRDKIGFLRPFRLSFCVLSDGG